MDQKAWKIIALVALLANSLLIVSGIYEGVSTSFFINHAVQLAGIVLIVAWVFREDVEHKPAAEVNEVNKSLSVNHEGEIHNEYINLRRSARHPRPFSYEELEKVSDNFRHPLGSGGSGSVFIGVLEDRTKVAVKRIERKEFGEREFEAEIAAIASVKHVNLVRLCGYCSCIRNGKRFLFIVYDFYPMGSLEKRIFPGQSVENASCLSWRLRFRVAVDIAKALVYLHRDCGSKILHLDIKPENILLEDLHHYVVPGKDRLDENLRAVLSDFGLSKVMNIEESTVRTICRGSNGYMAPEMLFGNKISEKCDYFSYGKVLLDLFFGQRYVSFDANGNGNPQQEWVYKCKLQQNVDKEILNFIDKRLIENGEVDVGKAESFLNMALWCLEDDPIDRPDNIQLVVNVLEGL